VRIAHVAGHRDANAAIGRAAAVPAPNARRRPGSARILQGKSDIHHQILASGPATIGRRLRRRGSMRERTRRRGAGATRV